MDEMQEIMEDFLIEAFEMIEQLDQDLVELENNPEDLDLLNRIFRVAHTIKGSSSFLNFDILTFLTHNMEEVLNKARKGELKITSDVMDVVLESVDLIKALLVAIRNDGTDANSGIDVSGCVSRLQAISKGDESISPKGTKAQNSADTQKSKDLQKDSKTLEVASNTASPAEQKVQENASSTPSSEEEKDYSKMSDAEVEAEIARLLSQRQEEDRKLREEQKKKGIVLDIQAPKDVDAEPKPPKSEASKTEIPKSYASKDEAKHSDHDIHHKVLSAGMGLDSKSSKDGKSPSVAVEPTVRVDVKRLDHLMNLIGELVLGKNRLIRIYGDVEERYEGERFLEELNQVVSSISTVTTDLQLAVMKTRMLPVGKVFNRFPRMVRDLSRELGKNIELDISGEETELDKSIVEEIGDPLIHIIRNSCDHGIERPEDRLAAGKSEVGKIDLKAYNEGNHIVIEIKDDGKGLDAEMLRRKAVEKGLMSQKDADSMTDKEAYAIIFKPGFSTATTITNVSGRGVGMDVVKTNVERLNGLIEIDSEKGIGTTLKLKIPLTLAIMQALLVGAQEEYYAIPLSSVLETVRVGQDEIYTVDGKSVLRLRDEVLSLVRLADIFKIDSILGNISEVYVVIIGLAEQKIGVIVDYLIGQEEVVIKSLGYYLKGTEGIAGATVRGDGKITLIADVAAMMDMAKHVKVSVNNLISEASNSKVKSAPSDYIVLAIDDSTTDRAIMKKCLKPLGVTVLEATNGLEALDLLKNGDKQIDAVLVDIEMPRMDGYTFASEVRKYNKFKNLPLIAVTSRTSKTDRMRGVESGMTEYITKPYTPEYLLNVVKRNINLPSS
ncbi:chemotaxis protein CheW [Helicobacter sp. 11S02629-2]|uniref:hybrid sensor histidine kinase/response regulator n=1 Tax=Helicobacter sp. 11S02629-2 TaxID=1476195 RepID=UPI000BA591AC|nr:chemotaxis protein CheW [Helicobacter sp. 11S02629-2]PAF45843.1 chemotaxis protein CheA [Helicobacter sp. 11S02629-2]